MLLDEENGFVKQLPQPLKDGYIKQKYEKLKEIKTESSNKFSEYFKRKDKGIKEDKYHKEVLNSCIFPFAQTGSFHAGLDYVYLRSSPLSELGLKNVDFLIVSQIKGIAIFGEAKGTIENPNLVISQYRERMKIINENVDEIKKYVPNLKKIEFVLGVPSMDSVNTIKAILRSKIDIILWETGGIGEQELSLVVPPNIDSELKKTVMHSDNDLNRALSKLPTSKEWKTFFHESHPVTKMALLVALDKNRKKHFTYDMVKKIVNTELDNTPDEVIEKTTRDIIRLVININFVNCKSSGNYKIQSLHTNSKSRYDELKKKWIEYTSTQDELVLMNNAIKKIQAEFNEKKKKFGQLDDFLNKEKS